MIRLLVLMVLAATLFGNCGKGTPAPDVSPSPSPSASPSGSALASPYCHLEDFKGFCVYYSGSGYNDSTAAADCMARGSGIQNSTVCPAANLILSCYVVPPGSTTQTYSIFYYSAGTQAYTTATATADCQAKGGAATTGGGSSTVEFDSATSQFKRCDIGPTTSHTCVKYTGSSWTSGVETACTGSDRATATVCPSTAMLGACAVTNTTNLGYTQYYYSDGTSPSTAASAAAACAASPGGGTWTAKP